jgi:hypothetical protein
MATDTQPARQVAAAPVPAAVPARIVANDQTATDARLRVVN